jgi:hypothetical protein
MRRCRASIAVVVLGGVVLVACGPKVPGTECPMMPADSYWHANVTALPVLGNSPQLVASIGTTRGMHADFGSGLWEGGPIGIPFTTVPGTQPRVPITFGYDDESDPGPYPIPPEAPIEGGAGSEGDRHVLVVDKAACVLYETYDSWPENGGTSWWAGSGAVWDLRSNDLRPAGWTSADAAGLPILPGLVHFDEVAAGNVQHAIRITAPVTRRQYLWPATHQAGATTNADAPAMGQWFRLRSTVNATEFPEEVRPIIRALQTHGAIIADNGSGWYLSGVPDDRWDNDALRSLRTITGADFEAVDASGLMVSPTSGRVRPPSG